MCPREGLGLRHHRSLIHHLGHLMSSFSSGAHQHLLVGSLRAPRGWEEAPSRCSVSQRIPRDAAQTSPATPEHDAGTQIPPQAQKSPGKEQPERLGRHLPAEIPAGVAGRDPGSAASPSIHPSHPSLPPGSAICQQDFAGRSGCRWGEAGAGSQSAAERGCAECPAGGMEPGTATARLVLKSISRGWRWISLSF